MPLLSVDGFRNIVSTSLDDASVQALLDAAEDEITEAWGSAHLQTESARGGFAALVLGHRPGTIVSVKEYTDTTSPTTLAEDDYVVDGYILRRLTTGTHPASRWCGLVEVIDTPLDDTPARQRAQEQLVRMDLSVSGGVASERVGDWSVSYAQGEYQKRRSDILASGKPVLIR